MYQSSAAIFALPQLFAAPLNQPAHLRPSVISSSLGTCELSFNQPRGVLRLLDHVMMAAAASGITVASATGDNGSSDCANGDAPQTVANVDAPQTVANVDVPASSAYVTAVGGTAFTLRADNSIATERVWNDTRYGGDGGGGTSLYFELPDWQRGPGIKGGYRMVPDISFLADPAPGYAIYCTAQSCDQAGWMTIGGTSAATPLFAAGIALVNQLASRRGIGPMGWMNPLLYRLARRAGGSKRPVFRDVRVGDNDIFGIGCCKARPNYDRASGLGSLNFAAFARAAVAFRARR